MQVRGASSRFLKRLRTIASLQFLLRGTEGFARKIMANLFIDDTEFFNNWFASICF